MSNRPQTRSFAGAVSFLRPATMSSCQMDRASPSMQGGRIPAHLSSTLRRNGDVWPQGAPWAAASSHGSVHAPRCVLAVVPHIHLLPRFQSSISDSRSLLSRLKRWSVAVFTCYGAAPLPPSPGTLSVPVAGGHSHTMEHSDQIFCIRHKSATNIPSWWGIWKKQPSLFQ